MIRLTGRQVPRFGDLNCEHGSRDSTDPTCCGERPATWTTDVPWSDDLTDRPRIPCEDHAYAARRAELDAWLRDLEATRTPEHPDGMARVIQVRDLGAALKSRAAGAKAITYSHGAPGLEGHATFSGVFATDAAHLARRALGEVSP